MIIKDKKVLKSHTGARIGYLTCLLPVLSWPISANARALPPSGFSFGSSSSLLTLLLLMALVLFLLAVILRNTTLALRKTARRRGEEDPDRLKQLASTLNSEQIDSCLKHKRRPGALLLVLAAIIAGFPASAQATDVPAGASLFSEGGIIITLILLFIPIAAGIAILIVKVRNAIKQRRNSETMKAAGKLADYINSMSEAEVERLLVKRKQALDYRLQDNELGGTVEPEDEKGLLTFNANSGLPIVAQKKKALKRPNIDPALAKLILWYLGTAAFWLLFGTTVGEYLGIKFVAPDADHVSWLSFGRLRPVHTNAVFWGWASLGMLGLGYYVVPRVSNTALASLKKGWYSLFLINAAVIIGSIFLMAGINNGGGEYREYIWPVMLLFGIGLALTLANFLQTIGRRTTREIYISNWYMVSAIIFTIVIALVAYIPYWQNGLGETIVQGYYMHQGVGMWFMLFTLGIVYYFLPQQLNKPIYSYSLGILAFWTQILFYTLIGTHHFVFSAIPWWLQTVAIIGSGGMVIPVIAGTTNFIMTFKGAWYKIKDSYTLPFFLVGIIFYFTGSLQGTAEAFRSTNLIWHFTDFTVAHSHLTMYGIISFFLWAAIYAVVPRLTGKEAPQITIGAHFWLALIGLLFYTIPLMYGSTLKGLLWMAGKPFTDGLVLMAPYWLWRAIGGSLMWLSHLFFAYNMYRMLVDRGLVEVKEAAIQQLQEENNNIQTA